MASDEAFPVQRKIMCREKKNLEEISHELSFTQI